MIVRIQIVVRVVLGQQAFNKSKFKDSILRAIVFILLLFTQQVVAAPEKLPLPRFASLRSNKVNIHVGPGSGFQTEWTIHRQGLPIEIIAEFDIWRQILYLDGTKGWVHKSLLTGTRTAVVVGKTHPLRSSATTDAPIVAHVEPDVIVKLNQCVENWCYVDIKGYKGWMERAALWGVYRHEKKKFR